MNDYLDNLITGSLDLSESVQPQLGSLFAPPPQAAIWQPFDSALGTNVADGELALEETVFEVPATTRPPAGSAPLVIDSPRPLVAAQSQSAISQVARDQQPESFTEQRMVGRVVRESIPQKPELPATPQQILQPQVEPRTFNSQPKQPDNEHSVSAPIADKLEKHNEQRPNAPTPPRKPRIAPALRTIVLERTIAERDTKPLSLPRPEPPIMLATHKFIPVTAAQPVRVEKVIEREAPHPPKPAAKAEVKVPVISVTNEPFVQPPRAERVEVEAKSSIIPAPRQPILTAADQKLTAGKHESESSILPAPRQPAPATIFPSPHGERYGEPLMPVFPKPMAEKDSRPTIRVNIGRIEVRAVMPAASLAPRTKRARSAPMLSLEDYLKQRQGVQR